MPSGGERHPPHLDYVTKFQRMVMGSGLFDFLKSRLQGLLSLLDEMTRDGRLQAWADATAKAILTALEGMWSLAQGAAGAWRAVWPWIERARDALGGWRELIIAVTALAFRRTILGIALAFGRIGWGAAVATAGLLGFQLTGAAALRAVGLAALAAGRGVLWLGGAIGRAGLLLLRTPLFATIAAIGTAVYAIYDNWAGFSAYFEQKIAATRAAFDTGLVNGVLKIIAEWNGFTLLYDGAKSFIEYLTGWDLDPIVRRILAVFDIDLFDKGVAMIRSLWDGMVSIIGEMAASISAKIDGILPDWMRGSTGPAPMTAPMIALPPATAQGAEIRSYLDGNRALGGPVRAGAVYRWMEEGQELFMPRVDGTVIPARELRALRAAGSGGGAPRLSFGDVVINAAPGQSAEEIAREVMRRLDRLAARAGVPLHDGGAYAR